LISTIGVYAAGVIGVSVTYIFRGGPWGPWDAVELGLFWPWLSIKFFI
jgi:hypothetical protein